MQADATAFACLWWLHCSSNAFACHRSPCWPGGSTSGVDSPHCRKEGSKHFAGGHDLQALACLQYAVPTPAKRLSGKQVGDCVRQIEGIPHSHVTGDVEDVRLIWVLGPHAGVVRQQHAQEQVLRLVQPRAVEIPSRL